MREIPHETPVTALSIFDPHNSACIGGPFGFGPPQNLPCEAIFLSAKEEDQLDGILGGFAPPDSVEEEKMEETNNTEDVRGKIVILRRFEGVTMWDST
jgi:hypothetical protein